MYNPYQGQGSYGRPPGYGGFPGQAGGGPPGMGAPPGMTGAPGISPPPGVGAPPGVQQSQSSQPSRPGGLPPNFQPPANMPNINFSAPVIRLGTSGPGKPATPVTGGPGGRKESNAEPASAGGRAGLGAGQNMDYQRQQIRENMMALVPPSKEEVLRTVFVGGISEGISDESIERILYCAGSLRRWTRASDSNDKPCTFGFAEFENGDSLGVAVELFRDLEVPKRRQPKVNGTVEDGEETDIEKSKLLFVVDDASLSYLEQYRDSHGEDPMTEQARLDSARNALSNVLSEMANPTKANGLDRDGDSVMPDGDAGHNGQQAEVVTIPLSVEDELSDIPAEMRETVAKEIAAFRERSNRRDLERLKREEEMESMERQRGASGRINRLASPPPSAPSGPAGGANGIPVGPRDRGLAGAPAGPKGYQGQQIPRDYQKGVAFVNGAGVNGAAAAGWISREDEDSDASDEELERRRREKKEVELEKQYLDQERRWLNRERSRTAALEREKNRDAEEEKVSKGERDAMAKRLADWDDDVEASRKTEEYYTDRSLWIRNRATFRAREVEMDERDRAAEEREKLREREKAQQAKGMADQFLAQQAEELEHRSKEPQRFKLSLGAAAQRAQAAAAPRATAAEVEGLLEDEEEAQQTTKRTLIPIKFDTAAEAQGLTEEERAQAVRQLAADIPSDKDGLWAWPVKWEFVDETILSEQLKPFVEKKIMEYLGVQEQMLVEVVEEHIRKRDGPQELVAELEGALDEEAEVLVKKLWRMIIFFSESEKRGLSA